MNKKTYGLGLVLGLSRKTKEAKIGNPLGALSNFFARRGNSAPISSPPNPVRDRLQPLLQPFEEAFARRTSRARIQPLLSSFEEAFAKRVNPATPGIAGVPAFRSPAPPSGGALNKRAYGLGLVSGLSCKMEKEAKIGNPVSALLNFIAKRVNKASISPPNLSPAPAIAASAPRLNVPPSAPASVARAEVAPPSPPSAPAATSAQPSAPVGGSPKFVDISSLPLHPRLPTQFGEGAPLLSQGVERVGQTVYNALYHLDPKIQRWILRSIGGTRPGRNIGAATLGVGAGLTLPSYFGEEEKQTQ
jgi:hypothetical protein